MKKLIVSYCFFSLMSISTDGFSQCDMSRADVRRSQITVMKSPYSYIVHLTMKRGKSFNGTGFFIHPRVILTAGHNLRKRPQFIFTRVKEITVRVGATDKNTNLYNSTFETRQDYNIFTNHEFNSQYSVFEDFGLIILPDSSAYVHAGGSFKLAVYNSNEVIGKAIEIAGYPGDKPFCTQWFDSTINHFNKKGVLRYEFATEHGVSGAPVWYTKNGKQYVFAIHTNGLNGQCGTATLITPDLYKEIVTICLAQGINLNL